MNKVVLRLKSGREFIFECESYLISYSIKMWDTDGSIHNFTYEGGIGEGPIWFNPDNVELIAIICKDGDTE